jgi:hypothetical protein
VLGGKGPWNLVQTHSGNPLYRYDACNILISISILETFLSWTDYVFNTCRPCHSKDTAVATSRCKEDKSFSVIVNWFRRYWIVL